MRKLLPAVAVLLIAACVFTACGKKSIEKAVSEDETIATADASQPKTIIGKGEKEFTWEYTKNDGTLVSFTIATDAKTVAEALSNYRLADTTEQEVTFAPDKKGETQPSQVKTVISILGVEPPEGRDWRFFIDGKLSTNSPAETVINNGSVYSFG